MLNTHIKKCPVDNTECFVDACDQCSENCVLKKRTLREQIRYYTDHTKNDAVLAALVETALVMWKEGQKYGE